MSVTHQHRIRTLLQRRRTSELLSQAPGRLSQDRFRARAQEFAASFGALAEFLAHEDLPCTPFGTLQTEAQQMIGLWLGEPQLAALYVVSDGKQSDYFLLSAYLPHQALPKHTVVLPYQALDTDDFVQRLYALTERVLRTCLAPCQGSSCAPTPRKDPPTW